MNDSQFAVLVALLMTALGVGVGVFLTLASFAGGNDCSVEVEYAGSHKVEYLTECRIL